MSSSTADENPLQRTRPSATATTAATAPAPAAVPSSSSSSVAPSLNDPDADVAIDDDDFGEKLAGDTAARRQKSSEVFAAHGGVKVSWKSITYTVTLPDGTKKKILDNNSGTAIPGRVLAVMGPSGAGKSTLTSILCGRLVRDDKSRLEGTCYLNDTVMREEHKPIVSFVCQDDIVMPKENPADAFRFSAGIKLSQLSEEEIATKTEEMIKDLKLTSCRDTLMGIPGLIKGLSGGEKRRTNIGVELIANPPVLYLDEPTSGLDSVAAYRIGKLMRQLAHVDGRTVICTVHAPSSELFSLFDDLLLLAQGQVVYHGPVTAIKKYFQSIGFPAPPRINPSEYAMHLLQSATEELKQYIDAWQRCGDKAVAGYTKRLPEFNTDGTLATTTTTSGNTTTTIAVSSAPDGEELLTQRQASFQDQDPAFLAEFGSSIRQNLAAPPAVIKESNAVVDAMMKLRAPATLGRQFMLVAGRSWRNQIRDPMLTFARVAQTVIFSLFIGLFYVNLRVNTAGVQDRQGLLFLFMIQNTFLSLMPGLMAFPPELAVFLRDQADALYSPGILYAAKTIVELPLNTVIPSLFTVIIYFMAGLGSSLDSSADRADHFFRFYCVALLCSYCARALGMLIGAFLGRSPEAAFVVAPLCIMPQAFVAGLFANTDRLEPGWVWLEWISFCRYTYKAIFKIEFEALGTICIPSNTTNNNCRYPTGADVVRFYGFDQYEMDKFGYSVLWLCVITLFFSVCGVLALYYQSAKQRVELVFAANHKRYQELEDAARTKTHQTSQD